jgi:hypothetical protein
MLGEGELEIKNQGRFWYSYSFSFSQETKAIGQQSLRTSEQRPVLERELSVWKRVDSGSTPHFSYRARPQMAASFLARSVGRAIRVELHNGD